MITGELKNKIDGLWDIFAAGGLVNPLEVIEQITYLMFIHDLDDSDNIRAKESAILGLPYKSIFSDEVRIGERTIDGSQLKWSCFRDFPADRMYSVMQEWVFPFIKTLHSDKNSAYSKYMDDAIFKLPTPLILSKVVDSLDEIYAIMNEIQTADVRGDVYEYLLSKIAQSGRNGQFRTPRHIIRMIVEMMDPSSDEMICDPACGTSGFLVAAGEYLKENRKEEIFFDKQKKDHYMNHMFYGYDMDRTMLRIGAMNMMTHGIDNPFIEYRDSLSDQNIDKSKYSLVLANPPFKGSLDAESVSGDLLKVCKTKKTELLFLTLFLRILKPYGRCACIVPDGVLFGSSKAHKDIRKEIIENHRLEAVISMPSGVFKPYAGVSTAILIFTKTEHGGTDNVWFYDMTADGFSLDDKRTPVAENDIPDIIERFKNLDKEKDRKRTDKSFMVPKQDIVDNDYDLSINKYKEIEYVAVQYPPTSEIMANIRELEISINKEMDELERLLKD
jgi:type I restriction enzyme M protein